MKSRRHTLKLFDYYKSYTNFFNENKINIDKEEIEFYWREFSSSNYLSQFKKDSEKFFDYLINRLHILQRFDQYHFIIPIVYKKYTCHIEYNKELDMYIGFVENEIDSDISGKTLTDIENDFKNTVDYVILDRYNKSIRKGDVT